ncbi:MAG TPA: FmdB family transcriptional regulator [Planctomycetaceae bacterium]|nr:FmdB family transcriptional regulator [Planctomycetaceae bacterium]
MPTYDYECDNCGHKFELYQGINDPKAKKCPACGKLKLRRLLGTGAAIVFKGSGFYQTDYRSDKYKKAAAADKPASEGSGATSSKTEKSEKSQAKSDSSSTGTDSGSKSGRKSPKKD